MIVLLTTTWVENYGDVQADTVQSFKSALQTIRSGEIYIIDSNRCRFFQYK